MKIFLLKISQLELKIINYVWDGATAVNIEVRDCAFLKKELLYEIAKAKDYNLHIFINSIDFIKRLVKDIKGIPFRTVCSKESGTKTPQINPENVDSLEVGREHLRDTIAELLESSELITGAIAEGNLAIVGANYRLGQGQVQPDFVIGNID
jgi:hypothetical protein